MNKLIFASLLLSFVSCTMQDNNPCSLPELKDKVYTGSILICDTIQDQFKTYEGISTLTYLDSIFTIHTISIDSLFFLDQTVMVSGECSVFEYTVWHDLLTLSDHKVIGKLDGNLYHLFIDIEAGNCDDRQVFIGQAQN
ncbi:MAG: hypothetical protein IPP25_01160 [Saprospiraceae bacterium]|nr:hypothetical protein [Candidatus Opimibacter skivensis]